MSTRTFLLLAVGAMLGAACSSETPAPLPRSNGRGPAPFDPGASYEPLVEAPRLGTSVTNAMFPAPVGGRWVLEGRTDEGLERVVVVVESATQEVWGVTARVVRDTVFLDGQMIEDTRDFYAQDQRGHVWYLGEDTMEYKNGRLSCTCGAWQAGVDGALPGVIMLADPQVGDVYRQEYFKGQAEDLAEVVARDVAVTVKAGGFTGCVQTRDRSAIEELDERKTYCPGAGLVLIEEGNTRVELVELTGVP